MERGTRNLELMASSTSPTIQICRTCGGGAPVDAHFCPQCTKILTLARHGDYFAFLGLSRRLNVDQAELESNFRTLSRQFHPDYFYNAPPAERRASLERSSYLNDAYRTLKDPVARVGYLLELEGFGSASRGGDPGLTGRGGDPGLTGRGGDPGLTGRGGDPGLTDDASKQVPAGLLEEVFALNEELDEVRELKASGAAAGEWKARLERARQPIERKRDEHEEQLKSLSAEWDALIDKPADPDRRGVLTALRDRMLERNYINNLLAIIERELKPEA
jgi:molecular chaperone HscB